MSKGKWQCLGLDVHGVHVHVRDTGEDANEKIHQANIQRGIKADLLIEEVRKEQAAAKQKAAEQKAAGDAMTIDGSRVTPLRVDPTFRPAP